MSMTRTQISLTETQREFLQRLARQRGSSVADVVRSLVDREMDASGENHEGVRDEVKADTPPSAKFELPDDHPWKGDPFFEIIGMASSGRGKSNAEIDATVYRKDW